MDMHSLDNTTRPNPHPIRIKRSNREHVRLSPRRRIKIIKRGLVLVPAKIQYSSLEAFSFLAVRVGRARLAFKPCRVRLTFRFGVKVDERGELDMGAVEDTVEVDRDEGADVECAELGKIVCEISGEWFADPSNIHTLKQKTC